MKNKFLIFILSTCFLFSCNSTSSNYSSSSSFESESSSQGDPIMEKVHTAISEMNYNYSIQKIETNVITGKDNFQDYLVCTDNSIYYKEKGNGYFIPNNDNNYAHHFEYTDTLKAYGRSMSAESLYDFYINKLFEKYEAYIYFSRQYNCYDISNEDAVYDFFDFFGYGYVISTYKEGTDIYFDINDEGKISKISLVDNTQGQVNIYDTYYLNNYGVTSNKFIDDFNESGKEVVTLIEDVKTVGKDGKSLYKNELVSFEGVVGAHYGLVYIVSNSEGLGIQVTVRPEDVPNMEVGNKIRIEGTVSNSIYVTSIESVNSISVISTGNELTILEDDGKEFSYGHYAANEFFVYPSYSGSLYNSVMSITGSFEVHSFDDQYLDFSFPAFKNGENEVLSGKIVIPGTLSLEQKQKIYDAVSTSTDESNSFIVKNMVMEYSRKNIYLISALFTEETTLEKDLTVNQKMQKYLGDVIPLPRFNESRNFVDNHVFAVDDVEQENYTWYGIVQLSSDSYEDIITPYINTLINNYGYSLDDHFGNYLEFEFHILTKRDSVIEIASAFQESNWGENASWMIHLCLYKGKPIKPMSTMEYIESVVGNNEFVLEDNFDNYTYQKYTTKPYGSEKEAVLLYGRNDDSHYESYKSKLLANGFVKSSESFYSRGRLHEVFVKNGCYVDICEYLKTDFQHGLYYEKNYRLEILMYKGSEVLKPTYSHDLSKFIELIDYDKSLLTYPSSIKPSSFMPNISFGDDMDVEVYYTRYEYEEDAFTGGYFPNAFVYAKKDSEGSYKASIDAIRTKIKDALLDVGFAYTYVDVPEGSESVIQKNSDMYMYQIDGLTILMIVDWDFDAGYVDIKCL